MLEHGEQRTPIKQEPLDEDSEEPGVESVMLCCVKEEHSPEVKQELPQGSEEPVRECRVVLRRLVVVESDVPCVKREGGSKGECFACRHCGLCYVDRESFNKHVASHSPGTESGDKTREECSDGTTDIATLPRANRFTCNKCSKQFNFKFHLKIHVASVHEGTRYPCHICRRSFAYVNNLQLHIAAVHERVRFKCVTCGKQYASKQARKVHIVSVHNGGGFECAKCGKKYARKQDLKSHIASGHNGFRFECATCGKQYTRKHSLNVHNVSVHSGDGYECAKCGKIYARKQYLKSHIASAHN